MPKTTARRYAFVLRIWAEEGVPWRGWVQHASSREQAYIQSEPDLLAFLHNHTQGLIGAAEEEESAQCGGEQLRRDRRGQR
jgi:hypothetical protein